MRGRGCKGGTRADDDMQVGVVGGQGAEIGQVLTKKADTEHACPLPLLSPLLPPLLLPLPPSPTTTALMPLPLLPQQLLLLLLYRCCCCCSTAAAAAALPLLPLPLSRCFSRFSCCRRCHSRDPVVQPLHSFVLPWFCLRSAIVVLTPIAPCSPLFHLC